MMELTEYIHSQKEKCQADISLCGWLEAMIGHYDVDGEGSQDFHWLAVYYDAHVDTLCEKVATVPANLVAYVSSDYRWSFVLSKHVRQFQKDTERYGICHIAISDFEEELLQCSRIDLLPQAFSGIAWIDDAFMTDETIPFDFDSFAFMDDGVPYLNPKHFSVMQLIAVMESASHG